MVSPLPAVGVRPQDAPAAVPAARDRARADARTLGLLALLAAV